MISDAIMLARNIDKAPYHLGSDAARRVDVIFLDCEIGNFDGTIAPKCLKGARPVGQYP
jgi:hypothetical protein